MDFTLCLSGTISGDYIHSISRHLLFTNPTLIGRVMCKILTEATASMAPIWKVLCSLLRRFLLVKPTWDTVLPEEASLNPPLMGTRMSRTLNKLPLISVLAATLYTGFSHWCEVGPLILPLWCIVLVTGWDCAPLRAPWYIHFVTFCDMSTFMYGPL